jgi:hypothetical protein
MADVHQAAATSPSTHEGSPSSRGPLVSTARTSRSVQLLSLVRGAVPPEGPHE